MMRIFLLTFLLLAASLTPRAAALVFAAASLTDVLQEIANLYARESGQKVKFSFGASSILSRQIQEGARADLFFSADEEKMNDLQKGAFVKNDTRISLLSNRLAVVVSRSSGLKLDGFADLHKAKRVALAEPNTVPAGIYAQKHLSLKGVWSTLNIVPTENVRAALLAVETGNVDAAIVYKTDATLSSRVQIAFELEPLPQVPISYSVAILNEARSPAAAEAFLRFLKSPQAATIFERHGFIVLNKNESGVVRQ